ncbi:MAG: tetratricopeptide repeat protein, partial [Spirochaetales bacterium]|nr:tetratricopeptide repeat protein [Spirochaetales bacterium]
MAYNIWEKTYGKEHKDVALACNNIGTVYNHQGNYAKALEYHLKALNIQSFLFYHQKALRLYHCRFG